MLEFNATAAISLYDPLSEEEKSINFLEVHMRIGNAEIIPVCAVSTSSATKIFNSVPNLKKEKDVGRIYFVSTGNCIHYFELKEGKWQQDMCSRVRNKFKKGDRILIMEFKGKAKSSHSS